MKNQYTFDKLSVLVEEDIKFFIWFGGFFDGEGCFTVGLSRHKNRFDMRPAIQIAQTEKYYTQMKYIDEKIRKYANTTFCTDFHNKRIFDNPETNVKNANAIFIQGMDSCLNFSKLLLPFLYIKKDTCIKFIEICELLVKGFHNESYDNFISICMMRDRLNDRHKPKKYLSAEKLMENTAFREWKSLRNFRQITKNEIDILKLMYTAGKTSTEISNKLKRTKSSIDNYIHRYINSKKGESNDNKKTNCRRDSCSI